MKIKKDNINFELNADNFTAKIIKSPEAKGDILIQRSINYNNHDFIITSIGEDAFKFNTKINSINMSTDSEIYLIENCVFSNSSINTIYFSSNVREFKEDWCKLVILLINVSVSPKNHYITYYENNFLLSKSNEKDEKFNNLIFARRNIEETAIIPEFVTRICPHSFSLCSRLKSIQFPPNSQLISIEENAFSSSRIENITIPPSTQFLTDGWCSFTSNLTKITLSPQNRYFSFIENKYIIKKSDKKNDDIIVFACRDIEEINVPSFIKRIAANSFSNCSRLKKVSFSDDSHLDSIGKESFFSSSIEKISIPSNVTRIEKASFSSCRQLKSVEFPINSQINSIEAHLFENTKIQCITIPPKVTKICQGAFMRCSFLESIEFQPNSELRFIEKNAFYHSNIERICFPSKVAEFEDGWCSATAYLRDVSVSPKNLFIKYYENNFLLKKSEEKFDVLLFARRNIEETVLIPEFVVEISPFSFSYCNKLKNVKFSPNSMAVSIKKNAFEKSSLKKIQIPSKVTSIDVDAFIDCFDLEVVEFCPNSELRSIGDRAFINTKIKNFVVPQKVEYLGKNLFYQSLYITNVEFLCNEITIGSGCFMAAMRLVIVSFPNLDKITIEEDVFTELPNNFTMFVKNYAFSACI